MECSNVKCVLSLQLCHCYHMTMALARHLSVHCYISALACVIVLFICGERVNADYEKNTAILANIVMKYILIL